MFLVCFCRSSVRTRILIVLRSIRNIIISSIIRNISRIRSCSNIRIRSRRISRIRIRIIIRIRLNIILIIIIPFRMISIVSILRSRIRIITNIRSVSYIITIRISRIRSSNSTIICRILSRSSRIS